MTKLKFFFKLAGAPELQRSERGSQNFFDFFYFFFALKDFIIQLHRKIRALKPDRNFGKLILEN